MMMLGWRTHRSSQKVPVLVMGGRDDAVFTPSMIGFSAQRWAAKLEILPDTGHMLMLDSRWQSAAEIMVQWLQSLERLAA